MESKERSAGTKLGGSRRRRLAILVSVNVLVFVALVVLLEGISSFVLAATEDGESVTGVKDRGAKYTDPYTGMKIQHGDSPHPYRNTRWAPNSLADVYYANTNAVSPQGLYTDGYGFIHNGDARRDLKKVLGAGQRIFIFGGSSVAGADGLPSNDQTIAAHMERILNKASGRQNQVVNAGVGGYESFREYIYASEIVGQFNADTLVFLDGRNDWYRGVVANEFIWNYFPEGVEPCNASASSGIRKTSGWRLASKVKNAGSSTQAPRTSKDVITSNYVPGGDRPTVVDSTVFTPDCNGFAHRRELTYRPEGLENYIANLRSMAGLCIAHKKSCVIALQPTLGYGARPLSGAEQDYLRRVPYANWLSTQNQFFAEAGARFKALAQEFKGTGVEFIDLTSIFDQESYLVFLDTIHYVPYSSCLLGGALIAQLTTGDWKNSPQLRAGCEAMK